MAKTHRYALADYQLTIGIPSSIAQQLNLRDEYGNLLTNYTIGGPGQNGEGSFVGQISASRTVDTISTEGDNTGSWVHNVNKNKTGTIELRINQISDDVIKLSQLTQIYESIQESVPGLTLTINSSSSEETTPIVTGNDSFIRKQPDLAFAANAQDLVWMFNCGQVLFFQ